MLADKLLGQIISATERQNRKVDITNRLLGLLAKVKPGNLNSATSVPVAASSPKQAGTMSGVGSSDNNDNFIKLIEYSKLSSEYAEKTSDLTEKMLKVIESKFGLFNNNLVDIKEAIEEDEPKVKEEKPKEKFNFFKEVEQDLKADYGRVKEKILDFVVPGRARKKNEEETTKKESKEPKRPKVIPLVATPIQTGVANVEQTKTFDTSPVVKAMDRNTLRLIDKLDELKSLQGQGGSLLGDVGNALGGAAVGAAAGKLGGALKGGAAAAGRLAMSAAPTLAAGAVAVAGGAALDYGLGKAGVGKDVQGNDIQVNEQQDEANWQKMTVGQKIQSGFARGIEKIGDALFLGNMARQARADRVKKETDYLQNNTKEVVKSNEASTNNQKDSMDIQFSESKFAQNDPENYKKFVEFRTKKAEEIYSKKSEKFTDKTSESRISFTKQVSQDLAKKEAIVKFKDQIEAAGAGSVKIDNVNKSSITEQTTNVNNGVTNNSSTNNTIPSTLTSSTISNTNPSTSTSSTISNTSPATVNVSPASVEPVSAPMQSGTIKELTSANQEASKAAPPIIVNNVNNQTTAPSGSSSVQSMPVIPTTRNTNSTIERVMTKNAFFTLA